MVNKKSKVWIVVDANGKTFEITSTSKFGAKRMATFAGAQTPMRSTTEKEQDHERS